MWVEQSRGSYVGFELKRECDVAFELSRGS